MDLPQPLTNAWSTACELCGQYVDAFDGAAEDYERGPVRHLGPCPPDRFNLDVIAARPPEIADGATRIVLRTTEYDGRSRVTDDPARARDWLAANPERWRADRIRAEVGPRLVGAAHTWSVWDDGRLVLDAQWLSHPDWPPPARLDRPADVAIGLIVTARNRRDMLGSPYWQQFLDVVAETRHRVQDHAAAGVDQTYGGRWTTALTVDVHTFTHAGGEETKLWTVDDYSSYSAPDAAGSSSNHEVFLDEAAARAALAGSIRNLPAE